ncbi:DUF87 domain-containing protein (plasmid) [Streptomycetaceae bacterium NBC_01309]
MTAAKPGMVETPDGFAEAAPPRHRLSGPAAPVHPLVALARGLAAAAALLNPLVCAVVVGVVAAARWIPRRWRWRIAVAGTAGVVLGLPVGAARWYTAPYRDLADACLGAPRSWAGCAADTAGARWPGWLLAQTPYALALAACAAGWWLVRRSRFEPTWRVVPQRAKPAEVTAAMDALFADPPEPERLTRADDLVLRLGADVFSAAPVTVTARACRQHLLVAGVTGYGKSRTIELLAHEFVVRPAARPLKVGFLFADMKADPDLVRALRGAAHRAGRGFHLVTVTGDGTSSYNPIRHGTAEQVRSRIVETLDSVADGGFSEPHHREAAEEFLLYAVRVLDELVAAGVREEFPDGVTRVWRRDLVDLAALLSFRQLQHRKARLSPELAGELGRYFTYLTDEAKDLKRSIPGLATRIRNLVSGQGRRILTDRADGLDLYDAIQAGDLVLFSLAAEADAKAARQLGTLFLTDLGATGQRLQAEGFASSGRLFVAGVDEFSGLGGRTMGALFQRMRAGGGALVLCTQDLADLRAVSAEFHDVVVTNTNVKVLHRQSVSAALLADLFGTYQGWTENLLYADRRGLAGDSTTAGSGGGHLSLVDRFRVHPNTLKDLAVGEAVVVVGQPDNALHRAQLRLAPRYPAPRPRQHPDQSGRPVAVAVRRPEAGPSPAEPPKVADPAAALPAVGLPVDSPTELPAQAPAGGWDDWDEIPTTGTEPPA